MEMLGLLKIRVHKGINLPLKDTFHSDPYVVVSMGEQVLVIFSSLTIFLHGSWLHALDLIEWSNI